MSKLCVRSFAISIDGFGAGSAQDLNNPLGVHGLELMEWFFNTRTWRQMHAEAGGEPGGETGIDNSIAERGFAGVGAWILGRNMFGPVRGPWPDESWKGWWGDEPPYHTPVFVLTHYPRPTLEFENGTSFHFVDGSPDEVLKQAQAAAGGKDVKVNGGVSTVRAFWKARLLDELHLVMAPVFVGEGERLLGGLGVEEDYQVAGFEASEAAVHYRIVKKS